MNIFEFSRYKPFVREYLKHGPRRGHGQYRKIAEALRTHTTTISQIFKGEKNLTLEQAEELTAYLGLTNLEAKYLINLVQLERAGTEGLRKFFQSELSDLKSKSQEIKSRVAPGKVMDEKNRAIFYSQWYYAAISLLTGVKGYQSPEVIADATELPLVLVRKVLSFLVSVGLCGEENGAYTMREGRTHIDPASPLAARHHANWRIRAIENFEGFRKSDLFFTAPLTLKQDEIPKIRAQILQLIEQVNKDVSESSSEKLCCLNIDWFTVI